MRFKTYVLAISFSLLQAQNQVPHRLSLEDGGSIPFSKTFYNAEVNPEKPDFVMLKGEVSVPFILVILQPGLTPKNLPNVLGHFFDGPEWVLHQPINQNSLQYTIETPLWLRGNQLHLRRQVETGAAFVLVTDYDHQKEALEEFTGIVNQSTPPPVLTFEKQDFRPKWLWWGLILLALNLAFLWVGFDKLGRLEEDDSGD